MSTVSIDLTSDDVEEAREESGFDNEPVPEGEYDAVIFDAEKDESNADHSTPYLNVQFRIQNGEHEDRRVFDIFMLGTPEYAREQGQLWHTDTVDLFDAIGKTEQITEDGEVELDSLFGEELRIEVYHTEDEEYGLQANTRPKPPASDDGSGEDSFIPEE